MLFCFVITEIPFQAGYRDKKAGARLRVLLAVLFVFLAFSGWAQKRVSVHAQAMDELVIDGDLSEWSGELQPVSDDDDFSYGIAQDENNIYLALLIQDNLLQSRAMLEGISIELDANEKRKKDALFWFPYADDEVRRALMNEERDRDDPLALKRALMERSRGYQVFGFSGVPEGLLAANNSYGLIAKGMIVDSLAIAFEVVLAKERWDFNKQSLRMKVEIHADRSALSKRRGAKASSTINVLRTRVKAGKAKREPVSMVLLAVEL